jgi:hypothetical protein
VRSEEGRERRVKKQKSEERRGKREERKTRLLHDRGVIRKVRNDREK